MLALLKNWKLIGGLFAFFGTNGVASPFVINSLNSSSSHSSDIENKKLSSKSSATGSEATQTLNLKIGKATTEGLKLAENLTKNSRISTETFLKIEETDSSLQFETIEKLLDSENSRDSLQKIQVGISREGEINSIHRESQEAYTRNTSGKDLVTYLKSLKEAKEKIKEWREMGGIDREIRVDNKSISTFGVEGRTSLEELYLIHAKLQEDTNDLLQRLKDTTPDNGKEIETAYIKSEYNWTDVQRALGWINWKKSNLRFRVKYLNDDKTIVFKPFEEVDSYGWGSWEQNPFKIFFGSQRHYMKTMSKIEEAETALKKFQAGLSIMGNLGTEVVSSSDLGRIGNNEDLFKASVVESILDLEMQVASKLVEWIQPEEK